MNNGLFEIGFAYTENGRKIRKAAPAFPDYSKESDNFDNALMSVAKYADSTTPKERQIMAAQIKILTVEDKNSGNQIFWKAWEEAVNDVKNDLNKVSLFSPYLWNIFDSCDNALILDLDRNDLVVEYGHREIGSFPLDHFNGFAGRWNIIKVVREATRMVEEEEFREYLADHDPKIVSIGNRYSVVIDGYSNRPSIRNRFRRRGFKRDIASWSKMVATKKQAESILKKLNEEAQSIPSDEIYKGKDKDKRPWIIIKTGGGYVPVPKSKLFLNEVKENHREIVHEFECDGFVHAMNFTREWEAEQETEQEADCA